MKIPRLLQLQFILCNDCARLYGMVKSLSCVPLFATPWTVAHQAPLSMGFSRQEYWSGLPFPSPGDLRDPGIELGSSTLQADSLPAEPPGNPIVWYRCSVKLWEWVSSARDGVSLEELMSEGWNPGLSNIKRFGRWGAAGEGGWKEHEISREPGGCGWWKEKRGSGRREGPPTRQMPLADPGECGQRIHCCV